MHSSAAGVRRDCRSYALELYPGILSISFWHYGPTYRSSTRVKGVTFHRDEMLSKATQVGRVAPTASRSIVLLPVLSMLTILACCPPPAFWLNSSSAAPAQFYEKAWAGKLELMDELIAEEHAQRDMVWQACPVRAHFSIQHARGLQDCRQVAGHQQHSDSTISRQQR